MCRDTSWKATGVPLAVNPQGSVMVGLPGHVERRGEPHERQKLGGILSERSHLRHGG